MSVKKGDTVIVVSGKEKGKKGKVLSSLPAKNRVIVEGVNFVKRHTKPSKVNQQGGIVQKEGSMNLSNVMLICPRCGVAARTGYKFSKDNLKVRFCKKCENELD